MLSRSVRHFATTAHRAAQLSSEVNIANEYRIKLAQAQGQVNGLVGGMNPVNSSNEKLPLLISFVLPQLLAIPL